MAADAERDVPVQAVELEFRVNRTELAEALCARSGRTGSRMARRVPVLLGATLLLAGAVALPWPMRGLAFLVPVPFGVLLGSLFDEWRLRRRVAALDRWARSPRAVRRAAGRHRRPQPHGRLLRDPPVGRLHALPGDREPVRAVGRRHGGRHVRAAQARGGA